jgi:hypothetical protein
MTVKWRGNQGEFTRDFEMNESDKNTITVNNYRCTPTCTVPMTQYDTPFVRPKHVVVVDFKQESRLRTCKIYSKVHKDLDVDF